MAQLATVKEGAVARPLNILVPLIKADFDKAEKAGMDYYKAAGEKLNEAREGYFEGNTAGFFKWAEKHFGKSKTTLRTYMAFGTLHPGKSFKSLSEFSHKHQGYEGTSRSSGRLHREWTAPIDAVAEKARNDARRLALEDSLTRQQEREAERKLALRLIDIGFKVLARELHPDKIGGDREAMARLNRVRDRLKECI